MKCPKCGKELVDINDALIPETLEFDVKKELLSKSNSQLTGELKYYCYNCECEYYENLFLYANTNPRCNKYFFVQYFNDIKKKFEGKTYSYKSDLDLNIGDYVEIEKGDIIVFGLITDISFFEDVVAPYPYEKLKTIIRKVSEDELYGNNKVIVENDWIEKKIKKIRKYLRKYKLYLELQLLNYEGYYLYFAIVHIKKIDAYKLVWIDLEEMESNNVDKYIGSEYIPNIIIDQINNDFSKIVTDTNYNEPMKKYEDVVKFYANIKTLESDCIYLTFSKFLPKALGYYSHLLIFIFNNLPRKFENFLYELLAVMTDTATSYEYKKEFNFDLFKGDINSIFAYPIRDRGKKYYDDKAITYLEQVDDRYFAVVEGTEKYVVVIKYNEEEKVMQVYCSCPCEFYCKHMYAVILAIRNNEFNRFYKIMYKKQNESLMDRIMNFDYFLCMGIIEQNLEIINHEGEIELVPILDTRDKCKWEVLEDAENETLLKQINEFIRER